MQYLSFNPFFALAYSSHSYSRFWVVHWSILCYLNGRELIYCRLCVLKPTRRWSTWLVVVERIRQVSVSRSQIIESMCTHLFSSCTDREGLIRTVKVIPNSEPD